MGETKLQGNWTNWFKKWFTEAFETSNTDAPAGQNGVNAMKTQAKHA